MIKCSNVHFSVNQSRLLSNVSWEAPMGKISAIVGPNGAGKSTLLKVLLGQLKPQHGEISLQGKRLENWSSSNLPKVRAYMAQAERPRLSFPTYEYLALARLHCKESQETTDYFVHQVITRLDIGHLARKSIDALSGGEFQRIELARAWCQLISENGVKDTLLILDEPASALDINQTQRLYDNLSHFTSQGGTAVVVEHDINLAARFCDSMMLLRKGHCVANGTTEHTFTLDNINACFDVNGQILTNQHTGSLSFSL